MQIKPDSVVEICECDKKRIPFFLMERHNNNELHFDCIIFASIFIS